MRGRLQRIGTLQKFESMFGVGVEQKLARKLQAVRIFGIRVHHTAKQLLRLAVASHLGVGLR